MNSHDVLREEKMNLKNLRRLRSRQVPLIVDYTKLTEFILLY